MGCDYLNLVLIDSAMAGASGDKILSALADMGSEAGSLEDAVIKALGAVPGVSNAKVHFRKAFSYGIAGTRLDIGMVEEEGKDVESLRVSLTRASEAAELSPVGKESAREALEILIGAEVQVHGKMHLHELADADTVADIVGVIKAIEALGLEGADFYTTPVAVGCGSVECRHGKLPVPAPATIRILQKAGVPIISTHTAEELTTPTGAALIAVLTQGKSMPPPFKVIMSGTGIGTRELPFANITRVIAGKLSVDQERVCILETNVDDVSGEALGWLVQQLQGKAEDVAIFPMVTKKNRPGHSIRVVVKPEQKDEVAKIIFKETGTLGIKLLECTRMMADRIEKPERVYVKGREYVVMVKSSSMNNWVKPAFEDCKNIALKEGIGLTEVCDSVKEQVIEKRRRQDQ